MNNRNQTNHQIIMNEIEDVFVDVISLLSLFFSNSYKCLLFIISMFFLIFRSHSFDYFWSWDFSSERLCWEDNSKSLSCWECHWDEYRFRCDRFRFFTSYFIRWNCDFESQRKKKSLKWTNFFYERKLKWRRTTTL